MIYINIIGGLGNQMFQYAFLKQIEFELGIKNVKGAIHDFKSYPRSYEIENIFNLNFKHANFNEVSSFYTKSFFRKVIRRLSGDIYITEMRTKDIDIIKNDMKRSRNAFLYGYWQSENYFKNVASIIREDFKFPVHKLSSKNSDILDHINRDSSVSIHVRRGDYLNPSIYKKYGHICDKKYYQNAINHTISLIDNPTFYIFSEDISYCKKNLDFHDKETVFVDWNTDIESFWDMFLMSQCKNNIVANSSFSWWAAWLNSKINKLVITPIKWMTDDYIPNRIPESWVKLKY